MKKKLTKEQFIQKVNKIYDEVKIKKELDEIINECEWQYIKNK